MVFRKFVKCFKHPHFKEHFRTASFEIICESRPFLKKCGLELQYNHRKGLSQSDFPETVTKFFGALNTIHLSTEAPLGSNSLNNLIG